MHFVSLLSLVQSKLQNASVQEQRLCTRCMVIKELARQVSSHTSGLTKVFGFVFSLGKLGLTSVTACLSKVK